MTDVHHSTTGRRRAHSRSRTPRFLAGSSDQPTATSNPNRSANRDAQPEQPSEAKAKRGVRVAEPPLAASAAPPHKRRRRPAPRSPRTRVAHRLRGRYWDRTSDLFRVREARYRCANRPRNPQPTEVLEVETGFEPVYTALQAVASPLGHSTTEKAGPPNPLRADDRVRTGDLNLGKVALYQLSYVRVAPTVSARCESRTVAHFPPTQKPDSAVSSSGYEQRESPPSCHISPTDPVHSPRRSRPSDQPFNDARSTSRR